MKLWHTVVLLSVCEVFANTKALPPAYSFKEFAFTAPADSTPCGKANNTSAKIQSVNFAQTHLMNPSWPLFYMAGNRPALVSVLLGGTGKAPDVKITARVNGTLVGQACLTGPAQIPALLQNDTPSITGHYTMTLPSAWVQPGLSIGVKAGNDSTSFTSVQMNVSSPSELNLLMVDMDVLNYNDGKIDPEVPSDWLPNFAAAMPASVTRVGRFPVRMSFDKIIFAGSADVPILACRTDLADKTGCSDYSAVEGMDQLAAVLRFTGALSRATGLYSFGFTYGNSKYLAPGGWGGGKNFAGADFGGIFLHEMGHALGLPHWGEGSFGNQNPTSDEFTYPYAGVGNNGGGRGQSWNYEPNTNEFMSPLCKDSSNSLLGKERSDAMQRSSYCLEWRKTGAGPWDGFGDFSALSIHEFLNGNAGEHSGTVPYFGNNPTFHLPTRSGFPTLTLDNNGNHVLVRGATQPQQKQDFETYDFLQPQQWNTPVYTIYGTYHPQYGIANIIYKPLSYVGTMPKLLDPTDPKVFADLKAGNSGPYSWYFYWEHDVSLRFTYADGTQRVAIYPYDAVSRSWVPEHNPWRFDLLYFAINIPADKKLAKVEVFHRPFLVRGASDTISGNIAYANSTTTPQNFLDGATLMASRTFTDIVPPVVHTLQPQENLQTLEQLGGLVSIQDIKGRMVQTFALAPGQELQSLTRSMVHTRGIWIVTLQTTRGSLTRRIAIP